MSMLVTWFWLGAIAMAIGTVALAYGFRLVPRQNWRRYSILVAVPAIAVGAYILLAFEVGVLETQAGDPLFSMRYVDWLLTTPLHVLYLGLLAGATLGAINRSLVLMALTIIFGFAGAYVVGPMKWVLFAAGSVAFVGVIYYAYTEFDRAVQAKDGRTVALFWKLRAFLVILWLVYPAIWMVSPFGVGFMNVETAALVLSYLDVVAKVGFGFIALSGQLSITERGTETEIAAD